MSYFEFVFSGIVTPEYEEKTKLLLKTINENVVPFVFHKYYDETITDDKKNRTLIVHSQLNMSDYLYRHFANCGLEYRVYYKQRII